MRGIRSNYLSLFESPANETKEPSKRQGRSDVLYSKETEFIIYRHYFFVKICNKPYNISLELLEGENFIAQRTIQNRFQNAHSLMREVFRNKPDLKHLKDKYQHINWQC